MDNRNNIRKSDITQPPLDELLEKVDSKFAISVLAADRARQLTELNKQFQQGQLDSYDEVAVKAIRSEENLLNESFREINDGLIKLVDKKEAESKEKQIKDKKELQENAINDIVDAIADENIESLKSAFIENNAEDSSESLEDNLE